MRGPRVIANRNVTPSYDHKGGDALAMVGLGGWRELLVVRGGMLGQGSSTLPSPQP